MLDSLFASAGLKLTIYYTLAILLLSSSISVLFYQRTASVIEGEYARIEQRWQHDMDQIGSPFGRQMGRRILQNSWWPLSCFE